jgi:hypothetical protein
MDDDPLDPRTLATDLLAALDTVVAATASRMIAICEEHGIGIEEGHLLLEPTRTVADSRASRRVRSRMRQRDWLDADGELTLEGRRLAQLLRRAVDAALTEHIAGLPRARQLQLAAATHLLGGGLEELAAADVARN